MGKRRYSLETSYRVHAGRRLSERYGVHYALDQRLAYERHLSAILLGRATFVAERRDGKQILRVVDEGREFFVGWCPRTKLIQTYLHRRQAEQNVYDPDDMVVRRAATLPSSP